MACSVTITSINGIVPPGQTAPDRVRIIGIASQCASGQVLVSTSLTSSATAAVNAAGRYRIELPITVTPATACGDQIAVQAQCVNDTNCFAFTGNRPLECCTLSGLLFQAIRPAGSLTPTDLRVQGTLLGCPTDKVVISSTVTATTGPIPVDPYTGGFVAVLPLTAAVQCDEKIGVTAACATASGCVLIVSGDLECPACYGSSVAVSYGACTGTPPLQPVTFSAEIAIPVTSRTFYWDFGDGSTGSQFTIPNPPPGTSATPHPHVETHDYAPGSWTATLRVAGPPFECDEVKVLVVTSCDGPPCPTVTAAPAAVAATCVNGKRSVSLPSIVVVPAGASNAILQWNYGDGTFGPAITVPAGTTGQPPQTHDYLPGTYTAALTTVQPSNCPDATVTFTVPSCDCTLQIQSLTTQVGPCDPATGQRLVSATVALTNSDPADLFYWQWDAAPTIGLSAAQGGTSQQHAYVAPGTGKTPVTVTVTVVRGTGCVASKSTPLQLDGCGIGCPSISSLLIGASGPCTADRLRRTVTLDATIAGGGVTGYTWDCGDGTVLTLPGAAGPQTTHEFAPGTYTVRLTTTGPGTCTATLPQQVTIAACCPQVTGLTATPGSCVAGASVRPVTLSATVAGTGVTSYTWTFGDGAPDVTTTTPAAPPHNYPPGSYIATVRGAAPGCPDTSASTTVSVAACPPPGGGGGSIGCAVLLWIAIFLMLIGAILAILGCILSNSFPQGGLILQIIGAALFLLGWLLFGLWVLICSAFTACDVILAVRTFVMVLIVVFAVAAAVLAFLALIGITFLWPCAGLAALAGLNWGLVLTIIDNIAQARGCLIVNPSASPRGSGQSAAAGAPMTAPPPPTTDSPDPPSDQPPSADPPPQGIGDVVKSLTTAMGITPCVPCQERARKLNRWFPLTDQRPPAE